VAYIWPFSVRAIHPAVIIGTAWSFWTWLWGCRYHVSQNVKRGIWYVRGTFFCIILTNIFLKFLYSFSFIPIVIILVFI